MPHADPLKHRRRAKIVATLGPASRRISVLRRMMEAGLDVVRLNFSHGTHRQHAETIRRVRQIAEELGRPFAILQDLQGPRLRIGRVADGTSVTLRRGQRFVLTTADGPCTAERASVDYPYLTHDVRPGDRILIDDGRIELEVRKVTDREVETRVLVGGRLESHKGLNLPGVRLSAPSLTPKDLRDLALGLSHGVDYVAMSFVRNGEDVAALRRAVQEAGYPPVPIIAKLERQEAIENLEAILAEADGVMVARGDLGVEVGPERVPSLQKEIIASANLKQRLVITATQMLESMIENPRPTRAEASDVANAVFDGTDALMLSGETAVGKYPVEAVETMARIISDAEAHALKWGFRPPHPPREDHDNAIATTHAARSLAQDRDVRAIAVFTRSGRTARLMASTRPHVPVLAFTPEPATYRRLALYWGVVPHRCPPVNTVEEMIAIVEEALRDRRGLRPGEQFVLVASLPVGAMGPANMTYLHTIPPAP